MTKTLLSPLKIGRHQARNRVFMAPMSRYRGTPEGFTTDQTIEYYKQRASSGLIVAESTSVNSWSGALNNPGIFRADQVPGWQAVVDAVHAEGGLIFVQLWHSGRATHQDNLPEGRKVSAPSAIASGQEVMTAAGMQLASTPEALSLAQIKELRADFANAAKLAKQAGFDGVEIHGAGGFIIDTFLQPESNQRTDEYGGSDENRFRFLKQVVEDAIDIWGAQGVAVKLSPTSAYNGVGRGDILKTFSPVYKALNGYGLAFLEVNEEMPFTEIPESHRQIVNDLRKLWTGVYVANGNYNAVSAEKAITESHADAVTFGRPYLANPDLVKRFEIGAELAEPDMTKLYGGGAEGYIDYPPLT